MVLMIIASTRQLESYITGTAIFNIFFSVLRYIILLSYSNVLRSFLASDYRLDTTSAPSIYPNDLTFGNCTLSLCAHIPESDKCDTDASIHFSNHLQLNTDIHAQYTRTGFESIITYISKTFHVVAFFIAQW